MRTSIETFRLVLGCGFLLPGLLVAQNPQPGNELEARNWPATAPTYLPGSRAGDPGKSTVPPAPVQAAMRSDQWAQSVGLQMVDGQLWGGGAQYKVQFAPDRVIYTPALPTAPHNFPVTLAVASFGRGTASQPVSAGKLQHDKLVASYRRAEFVESYEIRPEGIKQSFTFDRLPAGSGDLIVRMQMDTELLPQTTGPDSLELQLPGTGSVRIEKVVGFDAKGTPIQGAMRRDGNFLEVSLPSAAVDRAALPLVLDPLVGTSFTVVGGTYDRLDPDVAYDATAGLYLVTYTRIFSGTDWDVHGQRVDTDGSLVGGVVFIENSGGFQYAGRVADINSEDSFLVVYTVDSGASDFIAGVAVRAADGIQSGRTTLIDNANSLGQPDVGGEATTADNDGILVWTDFTTGEIFAKQIDVTNPVTSAPTCSPFAASVLIGDITGWTNSLPSISKSGGDTGNHMIVWNRLFTGGTNNVVRAAIVSRNLAILEDFIAPTSQADGDSDLPSVDGNGRNWVIAYQIEATPASGDDNIEIASYGWNPLAAAPNQSYAIATRLVLEGDAADNEFGANVSWTGEGALVVYTDNFSGADDDILGKQVDLFTCAQCPVANEIGFSTSLDDDDSIRIGSQASGGSSGRRVLAAWRQLDITTPPAGTVSVILGIRYDALDGNSSNLAGGCGSGGVADLSCMTNGNAAFRMRLLAAAPSVPAFLLLGFTTSNRTCGSCTLVPDPWNGMVGVAPNTDTLGNSSFAIAIPPNAALAGYGLYAQWAVGNAGSCIGFDLSNGIRATID